MAYREKMAWLQLVGFVVAYSVYFGITGPAVAFGRDNMLDIVWSFGPVAAVHGILSLIGIGVLTWMAKREGSDKADERDNAIQRRSTSVAYGLMMTGLVLSGVMMPFTSGAYKVVNVSLLVVVVCEIIRDLVTIIGYRRGSHG